MRTTDCFYILRHSAWYLVSSFTSFDFYVIRSHKSSARSIYPHCSTIAVVSCQKDSMQTHIQYKFTNW
jgi:hypothetical protein